MDIRSFLGATKHLYNWLCPSVGRSVGRQRIRSTIHTSHLSAYLALFSPPFLSPSLFPLLPSFIDQILAFGLISQPQCFTPSHDAPTPTQEASSPTSWHQSQPLGLNPRLQPHPEGSKPNLMAPIPALWPKSCRHSSNPCLNCLILAQSSIGHRLLQGRCPSHHLTPSYTHIGATGTADHLTLLQLLGLKSALSGPLRP